MVSSVPGGPGPGLGLVWWGWVVSAGTLSGCEATPVCWPLPVPCVAPVWRGVGVGGGWVLVVFEIWIVDASIVCPRRAVPD